ncbi:hypothetical protein M7I_5233 [Glarea lozoyensis 74030]|uniref:Uncharacterized protein n=1 Tax=Glarea lozoyensis (strain ATCC 74030 / MF5533) TaxID=1104152 RepID=H0ERB4_GLAL7|nr:hypothetical protein M7I_5233 [Glarea lozoyensis 74030]
MVRISRFTCHWISYPSGVVENGTAMTPALSIKPLRVASWAVKVFAAATMVAKRLLSMTRGINTASGEATVNILSLELGGTSSSAGGEYYGLQVCLKRLPSEVVGFLSVGGLWTSFVREKGPEWIMVFLSSTQS